MMRTLRATALLIVVSSLAEAWMTAPVSSFGNDRTASTTRSGTKLYAEPITLDGEEIRGPITPLGNFILVKVKDTLQATGGGILLPDQSKERPTEGLVMEAGPGKIHPFTAKRITNPVQAGISVLYGKFTGKPIEYKGEECQMIRDDDVMLYYQGISMNLDNVIPCRDYLLIEVQGLGGGDLQTSSGVVIAQQVVKDDLTCEGVVTKVGEGRLASEGTLSPSPVQVGEKVKFKDYAGNELRIEGKDYMLVKMIDVLCSITTE